MFVPFATVALIAFGSIRGTGALPCLKKSQTKTSLYGGGFGSKKQNDRPVLQEPPITQQEMRFVTKKGNGLCVNDKHCATFNTRYSGLRAVHSDPPIFEVDNFFSTELCESYISRSAKGTEILCQPLAGTAVTKRTSQTRFLQYNDAQEFIDAAQALTGIAPDRYEEPQVVRYQPGQQFTWHYDAIQPHLKDSSGNRIATLIVYLNDCQEGGETVFRDLELKVKPVQGKALIFFPSFQDGTMDDRTLHCGSMAIDEKWIAQIWIRENEYTPSMREALRQVQLALHGIKKEEK